MIPTLSTSKVLPLDAQELSIILQPSSSATIPTPSISSIGTGGSLRAPAYSSRIHYNLPTMSRIPPKVAPILAPMMVCLDVPGTDCSPGLEKTSVFPFGRGGLDVGFSAEEAIDVVATKDVVLSDV